MQKTTNSFYKSQRKDFRARLDQFLHPSTHIESPNQLFGRNASIKEMQDAFETSGAHPFIWGVRGIGKTSLGHTACELFNSEVTLAAAVACGKDTTFRSLIDDIILDASSRRPSLFLKNRKVKGTLSAFGFSVSAEIQGVQSSCENLTVNQAASLIDKVFSFSNYEERTPIIIIDEFDRLRDEQVFQQVADLLKQLTIKNSRAKICFCGVTDDLGQLLIAHESVERYIYGVELRPLKHDDIWSLISSVECEFGVEYHRGQKIRISQISAGYPHFAHLILKNTLLEAFDRGSSAIGIDADIFREGLNRSARQAAARLRTAYENAVRKGTDRYIEVLFAVANSKHMNRQFKDIVEDYNAIMRQRPERDGYDTTKSNAQDLRNAVNSLAARGFLKKGKSGWYQFHDPMLRSYVRLVAETEGVELSDDVFPS